MKGNISKVGFLIGCVALLAGIGLGAVVLFIVLSLVLDVCVDHYRECK